MRFYLPLVDGIAYIPGEALNNRDILDTILSIIEICGQILQCLIC